MHCICWLGLLSTILKSVSIPLSHVEPVSYMVAGQSIMYEFIRKKAKNDLFLFAVSNFLHSLNGVKSRATFKPCLQAP